MTDTTRLVRSLKRAGAAIIAGIASATAGSLLRFAPEGAWQVMLVAGSLAAAMAVHARSVRYRKAQREQQRLEQALRERELLLESIEVTPAPFALYDKDDRLIAWNKSYQEVHDPAFSRLRQPI